MTVVRDRPALVMFEAPKRGDSPHALSWSVERPFRGTHLLIEREKDVLSLSPTPLLHALRINDREQLVIGEPLELPAIAAGVSFEKLVGNLDRTSLSAGLFWVNDSEGWCKSPNHRLRMSTASVGDVLHVIASGPFLRLGLLGVATHY